MRHTAEPRDHAASRMSIIRQKSRQISLVRIGIFKKASMPATRMILASLKARWIALIEPKEKWPQSDWQEIRPAVLSMNGKETIRRIDTEGVSMDLSDLERVPTAWIVIYLAAPGSLNLLLLVWFRRKAIFSVWNKWRECVATSSRWFGCYLSRCIPLVRSQSLNGKLNDLQTKLNPGKPGFNNSFDKFPASNQTLILQDLNSEIHQKQEHQSQAILGQHSCQVLDHQLQ